MGPDSEVHDVFNNRYLLFTSRGKPRETAISYMFWESLDQHRLTTQKRAFSSLDVFVRWSSAFGDNAINKNEKNS